MIISAGAGSNPKKPEGRYGRFEHAPTEIITSYYSKYGSFLHIFLKCLAIVWLNIWIYISKTPLAPKLYDIWRYGFYSTKLIHGVISGKDTWKCKYILFCESSTVLKFSVSSLREAANIRVNPFRYGCLICFGQMLRLPASILFTSTAHMDLQLLI